MNLLEAHVELRRFPPRIQREKKIEWALYAIDGGNWAWYYENGKERLAGVGYFETSVMNLAKLLIDRNENR
jgi:hypothetical protein